MLEDLTGGFNYGAGTVELAAAAALGDPAARRPPHALAALPHRRQDPPRRRRRRPTRSRRRSTRSPPAPVGALLPATHAAQVERRDRSASPTARPARPSRCATRPVLKLERGRDARGPGPGVRRLGARGSCATTSSARPSSTATSSLDLVVGRGRARPGDPRDRRRLDAVRRGPAQGRGAALHPLPPRRRPRRQRRGRRADACCKSRSPASTPSPTPSPPSAASTPRRSSHARQRAVDGDPLALPRGHRRGLRVPGRRGVARASRARSASPPRAGGAVPLHLVPRVYPADRQLELRRADARRGAADRGRRATSTSGG